MKLAETLAAIEALDRRRADLEAEVEAGRRRAQGDPELRQLDSRQQELTGQERSRASGLRQLELEVAELASRVKSHERAIYDGSVRHPADLQRRQHELQTLRSRIASLEERELAEMESQEALQGEIVELTGRAEARRRLVDGQLEQDRSGQPQLAAELGVVAAERDQLAGELPAAALRLYTRTAARRSPAVARVVAGTCSGCRLPLPPRVLEELRRDQLVNCETCERILLL